MNRQQHLLHPQSAAFPQKQEKEQRAVSPASLARTYGIAHRPPPQEAYRSGNDVFFPCRSDDDLQTASRSTPNLPAVCKPLLPGSRRALCQPLPEFRIGSAENGIGKAILLRRQFLQHTVEIFPIVRAQGLQIYLHASNFSSSLSVIGFAWRRYTPGSIRPFPESPRRRGAPCAPLPN